jgi:hypothetical protein
MKEILETPARLSLSSLKPNRSYDDLKISSRTSIKYLMGAYEDGEIYLNVITG